MKWITGCMILLAPSLYGQDYPRGEIDIGQIADELYGVPDQDLNYEELYENLLQLIANPINLNKATVEDLRFMKVLSESQITSLLKYRQENDDFISIYELQAIPEFDPQTIYRLVPFVKVASPGNTVDAALVRRIKKESENYFLLRYERTIQTKKGFTNDAAEASRFKGSPDKLYLRFRSSRPGDFSFGFTAEKDQGEQIQWKPSARYYGLDYFSYHLQLQNKSRLKNLILGDYQNQFGQGLMLGGILGMGKGGETITTLRRSNIGLLPYTSVYEAGSMRGIAFTIQTSKQLYVTGFYSNIRKDATLGSNMEEEEISSFQTTGLHRNENELSTRKKIGEQNIGAVVQYKLKNLDAGIMFNQTEFDAPVHRARSAYNQFTFKETTNRNAGIYLNYTFQNISFFGEISSSLGYGYARAAGILLSLSPKLDVSLLYRKYDRNFYTFYSSGFGESSNTQNETGMYCGWKYSFNRKFNLAGYTDIFKFPWLRFRGYSPSEGYEWLLRLNYEPSRKVKIFIQAREEFKSRNMETDNFNLYTILEGRKNNYWINFDYTSHQMLRLKSRAQFSTFKVNQKMTHGLALIQDLIVDVGKLKVTVRYALFDTEDYDNRQYTYENDVWLAYSMPAYNGSGVRKMAIVEYKLSKHISFWLRYAHMRYKNQTSIGSSVDTIEGDRKNDIKFQVLVRF